MRDVQDTRSLVLQTVLKAFNNPLKPRICEYALLGGLSTLEELLESDGTGVQLDALRDATVSWVMAPRTEAEMAALHRQLQCECSDEDRRTPTIEQFMHRAGQSKFGQSRQTLPIQALLMALLRPFRNLKHSMVTHPRDYVLYKPIERERKARMSGRQVPWPRGTAQLVPHGPENSIRGLMAWFRIQTDMSLRFILYDTLEALLRICSTAVVPPIVTSRIFARVLLDGLHSDNTTWYRKSESDTSASLDVMQSVAATCVMLRLLQDEGFGIDLAPLSISFPAELLTWLDKTLILLTRFERKMSIAPPYIRDHLANTLKDGRRRVIFFAALTLHTHPGLSSESFTYENSIRAHAERIDHTKWEVLSRLKRTVLIVGQYRRCASPLCAKTFADGAGRFRYCGGCRRAPYCSKDCQKVAWAHSDVPHRELCSALRSIYHHFCLPLKHADAMVDMALEVGLEMNLEPAARMVYSHFEALVKIQSREGSPNCMHFSD
jgi:hypothetical protein